MRIMSEGLDYLLFLLSLAVLSRLLVELLVLQYYHESRPTL